MRFLLGTFVLAAGLSGQTANAPSDPVRTVVGRLDLDKYKAHIKGLTQFGDRMQGTQRNRDAIDWLEKQLRSFGYSNVERYRFMSGSGPLENIYATKIGTTIAGEMYIVSAHMDGRGGGEAADDDGSGCAVVLELARVLGMSDVQTNRSVRFVFWNNEEFGMDGSGRYALERAPLQGTAAEPKWLGVIQHDMMMFDHGMPPGSASGSEPVARPGLSGNDRCQYGRHGLDTVSGFCRIRQRARKRKGHRNCQGFKPQPSSTHRQLRELRRGRLSFRFQFRADDAWRSWGTRRHNSCEASVGSVAVTRCDLIGRQQRCGTNVEQERIPLLAKEGWPRHPVNGPVPLEARREA